MEIEGSQDEMNYELLIEYINHRIQKLNIINKNYLDL